MLFLLGILAEAVAISLFLTGFVWVGRKIWGKISGLRIRKEVAILLTMAMLVLIPTVVYLIPNEWKGVAFAISGIMVLVTLGIDVAKWWRKKSGHTE